MLDPLKVMSSQTVPTHLLDPTSPEYAPAKISDVCASNRELLSMYCLDLDHMGLTDAETEMRKAAEKFRDIEVICFMATHLQGCRGDFRIQVGNDWMSIDQVLERSIELYAESLECLRRVLKLLHHEIHGS
jgi:hypothetical protein